MNIKTEQIFKNLQAMINDFIAQIPNILLALIVFILFFYLAKLIRYAVRRAFTRKRNLGMVLGRIMQWLVVILGLFLAMVITFPSFKFDDLLTAFGIGSIAVGFAFKDIFQNFLSGILILLTEPFSVGDEIIVVGGNIEGTVKDIQTRATFIRTYDGRRIVIPNTELYTGSVMVNTAHSKRRSHFDIGVDTNEDLEKVQTALESCISQVNDVLQHPAPDSLVTDMGDYANIIRVRWWTDSRRSDVTHVKSKVIKAINHCVHKESIECPYPTSEVHVKKIDSKNS